MNKLSDKLAAGVRKVKADPIQKPAAQPRRSGPARQEGGKDRRPPAVVERPLQVWPD